MSITRKRGPEPGPGPRIVVEEEFSAEWLEATRREIEIAAHADYVVVHVKGTSDVIFAAPQQSLRVIAVVKGQEVLTLRLSPRVLIETALRLKVLRAGSHFTLRKTLEPVRDPDLSRLIENVSKEIQSSESGWREVLNSLVNQITIHILRFYSNIERSDSVELSRVGMVDRRLRRAIEFMHDNCHRELQLSEIAQAAYLSPFHFAHLFKSITGTTPRTYLSSVRIERARRLLAETDDSISEVGARVGYESQSHFTNLFKDATGMTPRAFRKAAQAIPRSESVTPKSKQEY